MTTRSDSHNEGWLAVDFDGTLAHYDTWRGGEHCGEPIAPMVERVKRWIAKGKDVRIFTARTHDCPETIPFVEEWCKIHLGKVLPITNVKDRWMIELWDDRAQTVITNTGIALQDRYDALMDYVGHPEDPAFASWLGGVKMGKRSTEFQLHELNRQLKEAHMVIGELDAQLEELADQYNKLLRKYE